MCDNGEEFVKSIEPFFKNNVKLKILNMGQCHLDDNDMNPFFLGLKLSPSLTELNISSRIQDIHAIGNLFTEESIQYLSQYLKNGPTLTQLNITECSLTEKAIAQLFEAIHTGNTMKTLIISENNISTGSARTIGKFLGKNTCLSFLSLGSNQSTSTLGFTPMDMDKMSPICSGIKNSKIPIHLQVSPDTSKIDGWKILGDTLKENPPLIGLDLTHGGFSWELIPGLKVNQTLKSLQIVIHDIPKSNEERFEEFCKYLETNIHLRKLTLYFHGWLGQHMVRFFEAISMNTSLEDLTIKYIPWIMDWNVRTITTHDHRMFRLNLKDCKLIRDYVTKNFNLSRFNSEFIRHDLGPNIEEIDLFESFPTLVSQGSIKKRIKFSETIQRMPRDLFLTFV